MSGQQNVDHIWTEKVAFLRPLNGYKVDSKELKQANHYS